MSMTCSQKIFFKHYVNPEGIITAVDDNWVSFARDNDWDIEKSSVLENSIWKFIEAVEVKHLYQMMMDKVRSSKTSINIPYRCDSPTIRRYMQMEISYENELFCFNNELIKQEVTKYNVLFAPSVKSNGTLITLCSWCKNVKFDEYTWKTIEDAVNELEIFSSKIPPHLSHGVCPACKETILEKIS